MFNIWIEDIQVQFRPVASVVMDGGILRRIRTATRICAAVVVILFSLHCTKPAAKAGKPAGPAGGRPEDADPGYTETGEASWYGGGSDGFEGRDTASGERMDGTLLTCAHRTLPFGTYLAIRNEENGRQIIARVNDRGPFVRGRILDVSRQAAKDLGFLEQGSARITLRAVEPDGSPSSRWSTVDLSNPLTVQVAALSDPANVESLSRELKATIGPVTLQNATTRDGRAVVRVRVGVYTTMAEAEKAAELVIKRFGARGVDPFITRRY